MPKNRLELTDEEIAAIAAFKYERERAKIAAMTPEEIAARNAHIRQRVAAKRQTWTPEEKERNRLLNIGYNRNRIAKVKAEGSDALKISGRKSVLKNKYGLTFEDVDRMLIDQGKSCLICSTMFTDDPKSMNIDHCHDTGVVRGILCPNCNLGLGNFKDSPEIMLKAITYLEKYPKHQERTTDNG